MKKIVSIFITLISASFYASHLDDSRRPFCYAHIKKRACYKGILEEKTSGFDTAYRKKVGDAYLRQMLENQKREVQAADNVNSAQLEAQNITHQGNHPQTARRFPNPPQLLITPRRTHPSCTHLRTPRNAAEIKDLLTISTILPVIAQRPIITCFDIQPSGTYSYRN
jgi:hypothetical protein